MTGEKTIVVYYSNKGSNNYLAGKIASALECEKEEIRPRLNAFFLLLMNIHPGNKKLVHNIDEYGTIILVGPIWMGKLIAPLRSFLIKYSGRIKRLIFVTCCGSGDAMRDEKFGHGFVFREVEKIMGDKCLYCQAFPVDLVLPVELKKKDDAIMNTRLSDENFTGEIQERLDSFISRVKDIQKERS